MVVTLEARGHIAVLTINRPEARNAVNGDVAAAMEARLDEFEADAELWVGVITGTGSTFSAGADLKAIAAGRGGELGTARGGFAGLVTRKRNKPLVAAVNGPALAGGCEIALACDMIVAAENARFGLPEVKRSLLAAAGGLPRLPRAIGMANAMEIILTGDPITAARAYELGLINRVAPDGEALAVAIELAERVAANAPLAVQASRNLAARAFTDDDEAIWRDTFSEFQRILQTEDAREGPMAFIEKREPRWKAR
jgi:enoyl-CoA hydratase